MTEPQQKAERRANVDDMLARAPRVDLAYKAVPGNTADFYALQVLVAVPAKRSELAALSKAREGERDGHRTSVASWTRSAASARFYTNAHACDRT